MNTIALERMSDSQVMARFACINADAARDLKGKRKWAQVAELYACSTELEATEEIEDQIGSDYVLDPEYCRELLAK